MIILDYILSFLISYFEGGMVWFDTTSIWSFCESFIKIWLVLAWYCLVWFGLVWLCLVSDNIHLNLLWKFHQYPTCFGCFREDLVLVWYGMVWFGMVRFGLAFYGFLWFLWIYCWFGMVWIGILCEKMKSSSEYFVSIYWSFRKNLHQQSYKSIFGINHKKWVS